MDAHEGGGSMSLPDLSKWREVPRGATIPKGTRWAVLYGDGDFSVYDYLVDTSEYNSETKFYTAEPVERPLADVLRDAYLADEDWDNVAIVAQQWFAKQPDPETHKDADGDVWAKQEDGSYTWGEMRYDNLSELIAEHGDWT